MKPLYFAALALLLAACSSDECNQYDCSRDVRLTGELLLPEDVGIVTAKFCSESRCVETLLDLGPQARVCSDEVRNDDGVSARRIENGRFSVDAYLGQGEDGTSPLDGARYTITITDAKSRTVLAEETREAVYDRSGTDDCHTCWRAELSL